MSADILDGLERFANGGYGDWSTVASKAIARIQLDAAEIVRLRGEVEELKTRRAEDVSILDDIRDAIGGGPYDTIAKRIRQDIAPAEAKDPAPAMPNGAEEMVAYLDNWLSREHGLNLGRVKVGDAVDAALRAADNRDAAGVAAIRAEEYTRGRCDGWEAARSTPAAVPAGEAVDEREARCIDANDGHSDSCACMHPGDRECTCHKAYGFATAEAMDAADCKHDYRETADDRLPSSWIDVCAKCGHERGTIYTTPPDPVQAAPQEGEAIDTLALRMLVAAGHVSQKLMDQSRSIARGVLPGPLDAARPSACELGADTARLDWLEANCVDVADEYGTGSQLYFGTYETAPLRTAIDRALQHRGDSRGGEG